MSQPPSNAEAPDAFLARLEAFRASGIRIDAQGRFWHQGATVEHEGFRQALFRWLDRLPPPDGRYILRLDDKRYAYIDVDDTPLVVNTLRWQADRAVLSLSDGTEETLDGAQLTIDAHGILRTWVRGHHLEARLSTAATSALAPALDLDPAPALRLGAVPAIPLQPRQAWPRS